MSVVEPGTVGSGLIGRARRLLTRPSETWDAIAAEPASIRSLYLGWVLPLAAIPVVAQAIGKLAFGIGGFGISYHPPVVSTVVSAVVSYALSLLGVFITALVIDWLAPRFGGERDRIAAFKVAAYGSTAAWLAGVFAVFPPISILSVLGLYSLYLLYVGLPKLMKTPQDSAVGYIAVCILASLALWLGVFFIGAGVAGIGAGAVVASNPRGTISLPGEASVDLGKLQDASKAVEEAAARAKAGEGVEATDPTVLQGYLPASIAGYSRTDVTSSSSGAGGMNAATAEGTYMKGQSSITLQIIDLGSAGALAGMASALNLNSSNQSGGKYAKIGKVDGRMTTESYDKDSGHGAYLVMIGERFTVGAEGRGASMADLKAAVAAVDAGKLEVLAKAG